MADLYDIARRVTDEVLGAGTYAEVNKGNPDPGVQAAIKRAPQPPQSKCDCCGRNVPTPFHHDAHDDSGDSWDYCQECYDTGCDLRECSL